MTNQSLATTHIERKTVVKRRPEKTCHPQKTPLGKKVCGRKSG